MRSFDPMATALSAIANASATPATPEQVVYALRTGRGDPAHLRALFADTSFETLIRIGIQHGITNDEIGRAYLAARQHGARNAELDTWCQEQLGAPTDCHGQPFRKR
jgi:hypothetical protein